jgi:hypothetical protein
MPRAIGHALEVDVALERLHFLPLKLAAVFGQSFAQRRRSIDIGIRVIGRPADRQAAERAERDECSPAAAVTHAMASAPDRIIPTAERDPADASNGHAPQPAPSLSDASLPDSALPDAALAGAPLTNIALSDAALSKATLADAALAHAALTDVALAHAALAHAALAHAALAHAALAHAGLADAALTHAALAGIARATAPWSCTSWSRAPLARVPFILWLCLS